ncbi:MAG: hypothetical protein IJ735_03900 [Clostridia bacterium]|nr:hypothetical protein [Clostridia bacterium]
MTRRVIGWSWYDGDDFIGLPDKDFTDEVWDAVLADVKSHGYLFTGEDQQERENCCPVLDDYRMARFSRRGFAHIMAEAHGKTGDYDYALYTESCFIEESEKVFPDGKPYPDPRVKSLGAVARSFDLPLEKTLFSRFIDLYCTKEDFDGEIVYLNKDEPVPRYLYPVRQADDDPRFWRGDYIRFFDEDGVEFPIILRIHSVFSFSTYEEFDAFFKKWKDAFDCDFLFDPDFIKRTFPDGNILLLSIG